ncbi:MAG: LysR family transcriptional regulator [Clostridia bacterium]|nr:LysR family transcriptional regulator [Clostridia bacterium]
MEFYQYQYFLAVADTLSFREAADRLFITRQAVGKAIAMFEDELGYPLFKRGKTGLSLTPEGERFQARIRALVSDYERIASDMRTCNPTNRIKINVAYTFTLFSLYEVDFDDFRDRFEDTVDLRVFGCHESQREELLNTGKADVVISSMPIRAPAFQSRLLREYGLCMMISDKNPLATAPQISRDALYGETFLAYQSGTDEALYLPDFVIFGLYSTRYIISDDLIYLFRRVQQNRGILMGVRENLEGMLNGVVLRSYPAAGTWNHFFTYVKNVHDSHRRSIIEILLQSLNRL